MEIIHFASPYRRYYIISVFVILYFCSDSGPQNEKKYGFDHQKKFVSPQVIKMRKKLENLQRDFQKSTQNKEVFSFDKSSKWPKMTCFSSFLFFEKWCFLQLFARFLWHASQNAILILLHFDKINLQKNAKNTNRTFHRKKNSQIFWKMWFQVNFPNFFLRTLRETKTKCWFQGDRPPSFLLNRSFLQLFWHVWASVFLFRGQMCLIYWAKKLENHTVLLTFWYNLEFLYC